MTPDRPIYTCGNGPNRSLTDSSIRCSAARHSGLSLQVQINSDRELVVCGQTGLMQARLLLTQKAFAAAVFLSLRCGSYHQSCHCLFETACGFPIPCDSSSGFAPKEGVIGGAERVTPLASQFIDQMIIGVVSEFAPHCQKAPGSLRSVLQAARLPTREVRLPLRSLGL